MDKRAVDKVQKVNLPKKLLGTFGHFMLWAQLKGGVKTERVFPGLSVLRKNNKMEVLSPEKWKY